MGLGMDEQTHAFRCEVLERLARLETKLGPLVGNGHQGEIRDVSERVRVLEDRDNRMKGAMAVIASVSVLLGIIINVVVRRFIH